MPSKKKSDWNDVFIILPTLNEEKGLKLVAEDLKKMNFPAKNVIVIDGGSTDGTLKVAEKKGFHIIKQEGKGKGNGFRTFLKKWKIKDRGIYVMLDADYTYDPLEVEKFVSEMKKGYDVVSGVRKHRISGIRSLVHLLGNAGLSIIGSLLFFRINPDICTGYWGFRGSALKKMSISAGGFDLEANLWTETCRNGLKHSAIKVNYRERVGESKLRAAEGITIARKFFKERFKRRYYKHL